jgi:hypothetical protein
LGLLGLRLLLAGPESLILPPEVVGLTAVVFLLSVDLLETRPTRGEGMGFLRFNFRNLNLFLRGFRCWLRFSDRLGYGLFDCLIRHGCSLRPFGESAPMATV